MFSKIQPGRPLLSYVHIYDVITLFNHPISKLNFR